VDADGVRIRRATGDDVDFMLRVFTHEDVRPYLAAGGAFDRYALLAELAQQERDPFAFGRFVIELDDGGTWRRAGTMGQSGCFSFYPGKNLGAYGEAGAVVTNDDKLAKRMRALRDHAQSERYHHSEIGFNYRMDALQGAVLGIKLKYIEKWTETRGGLALRYRRLLGGLPIDLPQVAPERRHVWHLFVTLHPDRDRIRRELEAAGIHTGLHYPIPLHLQKAYAHLGHHAGDFPVTEKVANQCMTLPLFAEMTHAQQDAVVDALTQILNEVAWQ
jgi:dTDP-4-amino-4,6-dideoxygalactose transaminase